MWRKQPRAVGLALVLLLGATSPVFCKDLNALIRILIAAFVAEQGAAMCMVPSIQLSEKDRIIFLDAKGFSQWIKQRITAGLGADDVQFILRSAANIAVGEMREVVRVLKTHPPETEYAELLRWCTTNMNEIANQVVSDYVSQRDTVDQLIEKSKQD